MPTPKERRIRARQRGVFGIVISVLGVVLIFLAARGHVSDEIQRLTLLGLGIVALNFGFQRIELSATEVNVESATTCVHDMKHELAVIRKEVDELYERLDQTDESDRIPKIA